MKVASFCGHGNGHSMVTFDSSDWPEYKQSKEFLLKALQKKT
jgi:hypothetical protein